jgi:peptide/nickel transport system substrate-binding protein
MEPNYWQRLARQRISRRRVILGGAGVALGGAAALTVGCGGGSSSNGPQASRTVRPVGSPVAGGSITWGRDATVAGLDPHIDLTGLDVDVMLYSYLYDWDPVTESAIANNLAESMEFPDPDNLTFIFNLRHGVMTMPDSYPGANEEVTSEDCKQSFIRRGTSLTAIDKRFSQKIAGSRDPAALPPKLETPDAYTFRFTMAEPFAPAIREMANPTWAIVPAKVIDKFGLKLSQQAYGSGPFMLQEFRGSERIVLQKHPSYFHAGRPYVDTITRVIITDESSLLVAFKQGQHDVNSATLTSAEYDEMSQDGDFVVTKQPMFFYPVIHTKIRPPFDDVRVREALDKAIDRDELIAVTQDGEGNYNGPVQWAQTKWALPQDELRQFYAYDPDGARSLLTQAGYPNGISAKLKFPANEPGYGRLADTAALLKDQWRRVGIEVTLEEIELGTYINSTLLPGNFNLTLFANVPSDEPDRPLAFYHTLGVTGNGNWTNYTNTDLDQLIDAQSRELDQARRKDLIWQAQRIMLKEHGPQIALTGGYVYNAHRSYVHFPYEPGEAIPMEALPFGCDIWTEKA